MYRRVFILLLSAVLLSGCSCPQRLARLQERCPQCFDTATVSDTLVLHQVDTDTAFVFSPYVERDTFYVENERVSLRLVRHVDTLQTILTAKPDTVIRTVSVPVPAPPCKNHTPQIIAAAVVIAVMLATVLRAIRKKL